LPWIKHSDIQADVFGSDHCPVYVDLHETIVDSEGKTLHLRDMMNAGERIPLPASLETLKDESREAPEPPPFATKWWDEFSGKQRSLMSFFGKKADGPVASGSSSAPKAGPTKKTDSRKRERSVSTNGTARPHGTPSVIMEDKESKPGLLPPIMIPSSSAIPLTIDSDAEEVTVSPVKPIIQTTANEEPIEVGSSPIEASPVYKKIKTSPVATQSYKGSQGNKASKSKQKEIEPASQTKLSSFFRQPSASPSSSTSKPTRKTHKRTDSRSSTGVKAEDEPIEIDDDLEIAHVVNGSASKTAIELDDEALAMSMAREEEASMNGSGENKVLTEQEQAEAVKSWGSIFAKKVPPRCIVHDVPCKSFGMLCRRDRIDLSEPLMLRPVPQYQKSREAKAKSSGCVPSEWTRLHSAQSSG
jgi:AP endonuclease-2